VGASKREEKLLLPAEDAGLPQSGFHLLRLTFATQYLKNGGGVVRLSIGDRHHDEIPPSD